MANTATYTKLKSGEWGIRVQGQTSTGQSVCVVKKSGESKTETVGKVVWTDGQVTLCTIAADRTSSGQRYRNTPPPSRRRSGPPSGMIECEECGDYVRRGTQCWETGCLH